MCSIGNYIKLTAKKQLREVSDKHVAHKTGARLVGMSCDISSAVSLEFLITLVANILLQSRERSTVPS